MSNGILDPLGKFPNPLTEEAYSDDYKELAKKWSVLPAYKRIDEIIDILNKNQVILVISSTGSGKTVLVPKALLHVFNYKKNIAVTLPKQIIAKSAAEYASVTLDVKLGTYVGYQFKGEKKHGNMTRLLYATDGTIVSMLLKDPLLKQFDGVCIDEAHEMKVQISFLLYLLKQTVKMRPEFKLVIMSATIDKTMFVNYFKDFAFGIVDVGGERTYPINSIFLNQPLEQNNVLAKGIEIIKTLIKNKGEKPNDILFFVPSINDTIETCKIFNANSEYCIEVYAGMSNEKQELAQDAQIYKEKIGDRRKIVIATNVAESSLTIPGIGYVIDSGLELHGYYDPKIRSKVLEKKFITKAQATQRMGRTGRTAEGTCYHLYTKDDFENKMEKFPEPAIRVSNIAGECLRMLALPQIENINNLTKILNEFIEPPKTQYVKDAVLQLTQMGFIDDDKLNDLGKIISDLQLDPMQGLAMIWGYKLNCIREVTVIIAMIDAMKGNMGELFIKPVENKNTSNNDNKNHLKYITDKYENNKKELGSKYGDHISLLKIFLKYKKFKADNKSPDEWLYKHFLKRTTLEKANKYYQKILNVARQHLFKNTKPSIEELMAYKLEYRILAAIYNGYKINRAILNHNGKYNTDRIQNISISKDSFIYAHKPKEIIYHELFTTNNKTDIIMASTITDNVKKLLDSTS